MPGIEFYFHDDKKSKAKKILPMECYKKAKGTNLVDALPLQSQILSASSASAGFLRSAGSRFLSTAFFSGAFLCCFLFCSHSLNFS